jgi:hypothetical protein
MRLTNLSLEAMLIQCRGDSRDQIAAIGAVIDVLKLTAATLGKVAAWRLLVMRTRYETAIFGNSVARHAERDVLATHRDPVPARGDANDLLRHRRA